MSTTISSTNATSTLAGALLSQDQANQNAASGPSADSGGVNLDSLQLSNSSIEALEQQAQEIAAQNQNSVIGTSDDALAANLQAVAALSQNFGQATAAQGALDPATVLSLTQ